MVLLERSQHLFREDLTELVMLAHKSNTHQHQWKAFYCHMFFEQAPTALENKIRPEVQNRQNMSRRMKTRIKIQVNGGKKKQTKTQQPRKTKTVCLIFITLTLTLPWSLSCSRIMSTSSIVQSWLSSETFLDISSIATSMGFSSVLVWLMTWIRFFTYGNKWLAAQMQEIH